MDAKLVKRIPYGISDYVKIVEKNFYYIDKTGYIPVIEDAGDYLFLIRPRRFGKSLFLSMLASYYDVFYKDRFEELFRGTRIYDKPTDDRGKYLLLPFNFSQVDPTPGKLETSFLRHIQGRARSFLRKYADRLIKDLDFTKKIIEESRSASDILAAVIDVCNDSAQPIYLIVDEYDNFANNLLTAFGESAYRDITHEDGFLRTFFNVAKGGATGTDAPVKRLFITGVSPVTMDDVTSGFNIGKNVSLYSSLDRMLGFTEDDVKTMVDYYKKYTPLFESLPRLQEMLTQWYGNYRFSGSQDVSLFNSDMILYFIGHCLQENRLPDNLIDRNVRIDYGKLRHLIIIDRDKNDKNLPPTTNGNFSRLKQIMEEGGTLSKIADGFPLKEMALTDNFNSLLFYFGLLTIVRREGDLYRLKIPNETIKRLYFDYISEVYREIGVFSLDLSEYSTLMSKMAYKGTWRPLVEFITGRMKECLALRDLMTGEKAVQTFLNVYLGLSDLFIVHSEKEMNKGYADLLLEAYTAKYPELNYSFLLELKYEKAGMASNDPKLPKMVGEAEAQLKNYALDEKFSKTIGKTQLVKLVLIFSGHEAIYIEAVTAGK